MKGEEDMAAKKAALLEKRLRREKEAQEKKQQQELDQEQMREAARSVFLTFCQFALKKIILGFIIRTEVLISLQQLVSIICLLLQVESRGRAAEEG